MRTIIKNFIVGACALVLSAVLGYTILAWGEPSSTPPGNNVAAPVNTGSAAQVKSGVLGFGNTNLSQGNDPYYIKETGGTFQLIPLDPANAPSLAIGSNGYVGIGTAAAYKLDVNGFVNGQNGLCIGKQCCSSWGACAELAGCANYNWMQQTEAVTAGEFSAIASSAGGVNLVAAAANGPIYASSDSGSSWNRLAGSSSMAWTAVASSADAAKFAAISNGDIYISADAGAHWSQRGAGGKWTAIVFFNGGILASSADGYIYVSSDLGVSWSRLAGPGSMARTAIASSPNGTDLAAISGGSVYVSTDSGSSWNRLNVGNGWTSVTFSDNGVIAAAGDNGVITSADGGGTWWFERTAVGIGWRSITSSSDGSFLAAVDGNGDIWTNQ